MSDDEIRLEAVTISRYPDILNLATQEWSDHAYDNINSELASEALNTLDQLPRGEPWEPPVGDAPLDESLQEWVAAELESGTPHSATWDQALAEANWDVVAAKLAYVKLRLASLVSEAYAA
jgi:hypothetical protein